MTPSFNSRADTYAEAAVVQRDLAAWLAQWLEPAAATGRLGALELGAGDGLFTERLAGRFDWLQAVDSAPRMVERGAFRVPGIHWLLGDAWTLEPTPSRQPDRLYSASLLQWCPDPAAVLRRWRECLRPGGRALQGFYASPTLAEWHSLSPANSPFAWREPAAWLQHFRAAGWSVLRSETETREYRFPSAIDLLRFFHRTGATAPPRLSAGQLRTMLRELDRRHPSTNGTRGVPTEWTFMRIEAQA